MSSKMTAPWGFWIFLFLSHHCLYVCAAPSSQLCPQDSIEIDGTCKCNQASCIKPACPYEFHIITNGSTVPGHCCTIYGCLCASEALLDEAGECKCIDPHKRLLNQECVCDLNFCQLPELCGENYVSVRIADECCLSNKCIKCPDDSFPTSNNDDAIEDKCLCYPCSNKECGLNETVVIIQRGNGFPGSCCDMYRCENNTSTTSCLSNGTRYNDGDIWFPTTSNRCECRAGVSFCEKQKVDENLSYCHKEGKVYKLNESWMLDSCTNCTCINGEIKCIAHFCEILKDIIKKPKCQTLNCGKECANGFKLNKRGCPICKCNNDDFWDKYNISQHEVENILENYFYRRNATTDIDITTDSDDICSTSGTNFGGIDLIKTTLWISVGFFICLVLSAVLYLFIFFHHRKKGSYEPNPAKEALVNQYSNNNYMLSNVN